MKTGTPPRLDGASIDWAALEEQPGDEPPVPFSFLTERIRQAQVPCHIAHTGPATHALIRENLHRSPMYSGQITGTGPRYCPSIEDKVVRFADRERHQIFLEPEGLEDRTVYPNGISTSLPVDVQEAFVHSIPGLEQARITQPGYAIEYDFFDPRDLKRSLETQVDQAVEAWLRWLPRWEPATHRGRVAPCRRCLGSPVLSAAGLGSDVPHGVQHGLSTRIKTIVDIDIDRNVDDVRSGEAFRHYRHEIWSLLHSEVERARDLELGTATEEVEHV